MSGSDSRYGDGPGFHVGVVIHGGLRKTNRPTTRKHNPRTDIGASTGGESESCARTAYGQMPPSGDRRERRTAENKSAVEPTGSQTATEAEPASHGVRTYSERLMAAREHAIGLSTRAVQSVPTIPVRVTPSKRHTSRLLTAMLVITFEKPAHRKTGAVVLQSSRT